MPADYNYEHISTGRLKALSRATEEFRAAYRQLRIPLWHIRPFAHEHRTPGRLERFHRAGPGAAGLKIAAHHHGEPREAVDDFVAAHRGADGETGGGRVRRQQSQAAIEQKLAH